MVESAAGSTGQIFISYRRNETAYPAAWLYKQLAKHYGAVRVFKDVDSIPLGDDFVEVITREVGSCDVLLALIGNQWLTTTDEHGRRRLDDPHDFVRLEIEAALARNIRVIPILVDKSKMPRAEELPDSLDGLARRQALELSSIHFEFDIGSAAEGVGPRARRDSGDTSGGGHGATGTARAPTTFDAEMVARGYRDRGRADRADLRPPHKPGHHHHATRCGLAIGERPRSLPRRLLHPRGWMGR